MSSDRSDGTLRSTCESAGFFVLRAPALPFDVLSAWASAPGGALTTELLRTRLRSAIARPEVREALVVAAPAVELRLDDWLAGAIDDEEAGKLERTLVRYLERMCWRATPFGLFAGTASGVVGDSTRLALAARDRHTRVTTLDTELLSAQVVALARDGEVRAQLRYRPTACVHVRGDQIVCIGARRDGSGESRALAVPLTPELARLLLSERAGAGATAAQLVDDLCAAPTGLGRGDAERLVATLIHSGVLVDDLELPIVGADPLTHLIGRLDSIAAAADARRVLVQVRDRLAALDAEARSQSGPRHGYRAVAEELGSLPAPPASSRLFHVVLHHATTHAQLDGRVTDDALAGACALARLMPGRSAPLEAFQRAFRARYDEQEVPLLEALDELTGIGFDPAGSTSAPVPPLLRELAFAPAASPAQVSWGTRERWLAQAVMTAARAGSDEIVLSEAVLASLGAPTATAESFAVVGALHAEDEQAIAAGRYRFHLRHVLGPTAGALLGRFCAADATLAERTRALIAREAELVPDAILAEVVHSAHPRMGNVASRPTLRRFEIPLLGRSASRGVTQLPLDDLVVSVREQEVCLHSRRRGQRVLPRLTYSDNSQLPGLPVYRFLACLAQSQGVSAAWSWGPLVHLRELPRVVYGRCILALMRWRFDASELERWLALPADARAAELGEQRTTRRLPRWVMLVERDRSLPIDLDNPLSVDAFLHVARGADAVVEEMFPGPGAPFISGPEGRHAHELVLPFLRKQPRPAPARPQRADGGQRARPHLPGGDWLHAKLYCEVGAADRVLRDVVLPLVQQTEGACSRWFFLRYGDPDWHLRVRFHGAPEALREQILPALHRAAAQAAVGRWIHRVALDTYVPEHERYGGAANLAAVERIFHHDSEAALFLAVAYADDDEARWQLTLLGMYRLLAAWTADDEQRIAIVSAARLKLAAEAGLVGPASRVLGQRYRDERAGLTELFAASLPASHRLQLGVDILDERDAQLAPIVAELARGAGEPGGRIVRSLLHLHANRVLPSHHRLHEAFLFDFLERQLRAEQARRRVGTARAGAAGRLDVRPEIA